ncbi:MAG: hypothetical protein ER33_08540 [Cyanobium sp. CACIAM 14]|nr:MAG: hypothetical protein ER33_08540 [Cyanobium sp. CACIAM 14]
MASVEEPRRDGLQQLCLHQRGALLAPSFLENLDGTGDLGDLKTTAKVVVYGHWSCRSSMW